MDNLQKSLTELIDETLAEIEALKKSERYSAHEIDLADDKANGSMDAKAIAKADEDEEKKEEEKEESDEAKKSDDEDEDDEEDEDEDEEAEMKKAEEACAKALKKYEMAKAEVEHKKKMLAMKKGEWDKKEDDKKEDDKDEEKDLKKSIDARVAPIESKLSEVLSAVKKLSDTPVPARGASYRDVKPLAKSIEVETLSKAQVLSEMINLKKSGKEVLSEDVIQVEDGSADHLTMARKYGIKA
jgi:hypothetical protein